MMCHQFSFKCAKMMNIVPRVFALLALISVASATNSYRLKKDVLPISYVITIKPYMSVNDGDKLATFDGEVVIKLRPKEAYVQQITIQQRHLQISKAWLADYKGNFIEEFNHNKFTYGYNSDKFTIALSSILMAEEIYELRITYTGMINSGLAGFYHANYTDSNGDIKWMGLTQLQRIDAREVFPCFDEPAFKAKFQLQISRPSQYKSISNTKLIKTEYDGDNRYLDYFEVTPIMSTYLVAFIISEYVSRGNETLTVFTREEYSNYTDLLYESGLKTLEGFNNLFRSPYTKLGNPTLQFATSPKFAHNGMENWGLIIFSERVGIRTPNYSDGWSEKEMTIRVVTHELAHMWFGNSVTMGWWNSFWLNEGFARYFEYFMAHEIYPEYQLDQQFILNIVQNTLAYDANYFSQPLTSEEDEVNTPDDIKMKLSRITYSKGASVLRMIRNAMGEYNFIDAIDNYLKEYHMSNTKPSDLFYHFKQHWPRDQRVKLDDFFYDWTQQQGYPMVTVNITNRRNMVILTQSRFLADSDDYDNHRLTYTIPITYATNLKPEFDNLRPTIYFSNRVSDIKLKFNKSIDWIVVNLKQSNYYRVYYDIPLLKTLRKAMLQPGHSNIAVENRAQIVDDLFSFAKIELLDYKRVFHFMSYLAMETEYLPWYAAYVGMTDVLPRLTIEQLKDFSKFLIHITEKLYNKLGFDYSEKDSILDGYNRNNLIAWLCRFGHEECNKRVMDMFDKVNTGAIEKPSPDFRHTFYCSAARAGAYSELVKWYANETVESERSLLWYGISCTRDYTTHYEQQIHDNATSLDQKMVGIQQLFNANPENVTPIFKLLCGDIPRLNRTLGEHNTVMIINQIAGYFTTLEQHDLLRNLIDKEEVYFSNTLEKLKETVTNVKHNMEWSDVHLRGLVRYLKEINGAAVNKIAIPLLVFLCFAHFVHLIHLA